MKLIIRLLGLVDIVSAFAIVTGNFSILGIGLGLAVVLLIKGFTSLFADWSARIYGIVDIIAALMLFLGGAPFLINIIVALILIYKGVFSLI